MRSVANFGLPIFCDADTASWTPILILVSWSRYPGIWTHGDWIQRSPSSGGYVVFGRSDATLNPGGVRIGTAEIYRQVERLPWVMESIAVGQALPDGDTRIVLFVVVQEGEGGLNSERVAEIKAQVRENTTPRHVPAVILQVPDIPRTKSGKITEIAVREVVHNRPVKNADALANPEALRHFEGRKELKLDFTARL